jgi:hypothetical protein
MRARGSYGLSLHPPSCCWLGSRRLRGLPVLVHEASRRVLGSTTTQDRAGTRDIAPARVAFRQCKSVSALIASFRSSIPSPPIPLFTLRHTPRGVQRKTRDRAVRYSFLVGLLHSLLHAGLSRRTALAILHSFSSTGGRPNQIQAIHNAVIVWDRRAWRAAQERTLL